MRLTYRISVALVFDPEVLDFLAHLGIFGLKS